MRIDGNKFSDWIGELLRTQGPNIFRTKGILNIAGENKRFVFQGVHMVFDGRQDRPWKATRNSEKRTGIHRSQLKRKSIARGFP